MIGKLGACPMRLPDVGRPALVRPDRIDRKPDRLDAAPVELRLEPRHVPELGGAHRREVAWVREQNRPAVADPFVKADRSFGRDGGEIGGGISELETHARAAAPVAMRGEEDTD